MKWLEGRLVLLFCLARLVGLAGKGPRAEEPGNRLAHQARGDPCPARTPTLKVAGQPLAISTRRQPRRLRARVRQRDNRTDSVLAVT
jgi:hypothetical protein